MCDIKSSRCVNAMGADGSDHGVDLCTTERPQHPHNHCLRLGRGRTTTLVMMCNGAQRENAQFAVQDTMQQQPP